MRLTALWIVLLATALAPVAATAADEAGTAGSTRERKRPGWFSHPAMPAAAPQLQYAAMLRDRGSLRQAAKQYERLVRSWPESPEAPVAQLELARILDSRGKTQKAFDEYQYLIDHFGGRFPYTEVIEAQYRLAETVMDARHATLGVFPGFRSPERAVPLFEQIVENAPGWDRTPAAQFTVGRIHQDGGDYDLAIPAFESVQYRYPRSEFAPESAYRQADCAYRIAMRMTHDEQAAAEARTYLEQFLSSFPRHEQAPAAREQRDAIERRLADFLYERARFYDQLAHKPESALIVYRDYMEQFPSSDRAPAVQARINEIASTVEKQKL